MKIVVDTNVFIAAVMSSNGASRQIIRMCLLGHLTPLMGNSLFNEYEDVCSRDSVFSGKFISDVDREALLDAFFNACLWVPIYFLWRPNLRDEGDNHVVELAIAGNAEAILTSNKRDFASAELRFPGLSVIDPAEFMKKGWT